MRHVFAHPLVRFITIAGLTALLGVALMPAAHAQAAPPPATYDVPGVVDLTWTLPTETQCVEPAPAPCVRLPLTGANALTEIDLYVAGAPIPDNFAGEPTARLQPGLTTTQFRGTVPAGSTLYFRLKARNAAGASPFTTEVSKVVDVPSVPPGVPTNVTVSIKVGVAAPTP